MQPQQQIQINASEKELKGRFSNIAQITHQPDHFVLDFFMVAPPAGQLVSRVAITPNHAKKLADVLAEQIKTYETAFGKIKVTTTEAEHNIGFKAT